MLESKYDLSVKVAEPIDQSRAESAVRNHLRHHGARAAAIKLQQPDANPFRKHLAELLADALE